MLSRLVFFIVIIIVLVSACAKRSSIYIKRIDNQTTDTLRFYFFGIYNRETYGDTLIVLPNEDKEILYFAEESGIAYGFQGCVVFNDSINVEIDGGKQLLKDLRKEEDWDFREIGTEKVCSFKVTVNDVQ